MFAIVDISGKQLRVELGLELEVPRQPTDEGTSVSYNNVLLYDDGKQVHVGTPNVNGVQVDATILSHGRGKKVVVFKKKRRKGYRVKNTHRQDFSIIKIDKISASTPEKQAVLAEEETGD
ncbi:MAG: 50S ribosomal protein L21 [Candidatus Marinimicrobia bacterium]|jgi:large subunit ribosomal protein L21|nr:50S ribosomal protein L21 [Candidatus Neomarinimicrobiota bacterium]MDP7558321.1 50S ribosomal protein L21 [Candidatus Neomarinimicrobiota bacterium]|tara:strand:- start:2037 stop:2396 length:360 start_codon:yes stop_codon:yes gene_type:complete